MNILTQAEQFAYRLAIQEPPEGLTFHQERPTSVSVDARLNGKWVGSVDWYHPSQWKGDWRDPPEEVKPYQIRQIQVHPDHQRQGIATALFNHVKQNVEPRLEHSTRQTESGHAWGQSMGHDPQEWEHLKEFG